MEIVNINYRGSLNRAIDLEEFAKLFPNSQYYPSRPCMVRIKDENVTILFFIKKNELFSYLYRFSCTS